MAKKLKPVLETDPAKIGPECTNCKQCELHLECRVPPFSPTYIPPKWDGKYFLVLEEPPKTNEPEIGMLYRALGYHGIDPAYGFINRCSSAYNVSIKLVRLCAPFLKTDINNITPYKIIIFGIKAARGIFNTEIKITDHRLKAYRSEKFFDYAGGWVFVVPDFEIHKGGKLGHSYFDLVKDLRWVSEFHGYIDRPMDNIDCADVPWEAVDIEWSKKGKLLTVGTSCGISAAATETNIATVLDDIKATNETLVNHGLIGDCVQMALNGMNVPESWLTGEKIKDTLLAARLYNEHMPGFGVEDLAPSWCGIEPWKEPTQVLFEKTGDFGEIPSELRMERCRLDAFAAAKLYEFLEPKVDPTLLDFNTRLACTLKRLELAGMKIHEPTFRRMSTEGYALLKAKEENFVSFAAKYGVELVPTNDNHFRNLLYKKLKLTPVSNTPTGLASVGSDDLILAYDYANSEQRQAIKCRLEHEKISKLYNTYIGNIDDEDRTGNAQYITPSWFVHPHINPIGARTGRRSANAPNTQNQPPFIRQCFTSRYPGGSIWKFDHAQLEPRILAVLASIEEWLEVFYSGKNFYGYCSKRIWNKEVKKGEQLYDVTKSIILGTNYGMDPPLLQQRLYVDVGIRVSLQEAANYIKLYHSAFPGVPRYFLLQKERILKYGYVQALTGHTYHIECPQGENTFGFKHNWNMALNAPVQGLASYITGTGLIEVERALLDRYNVGFVNHFNNLVHHWSIQQGLDNSELCAKIKVDNIDYPLIINEVHDEIVIDAPKGEDISEQVISIMQDCTLLKKMFPKFAEANIPLVVEAKSGETWEK